jgi:flavorubredoxin
MKIELFNQNNHKVFKFTGFGDSDEVETNQFLIVDKDEAILSEPGGARINSILFSEISSIIPPQKIKYIALSHQDPDVCASINFWAISTQAKFVISNLWQRFIPHFMPKSLAEDRIIALNDYGTKLALGNNEIHFLPAHFLHSEGNFQIYDTNSKILLSGDFGTSIGVNYEVVNNFEEHTKFMETFHRRYMPSSFAIRSWVNMVETLDIEQIVPQHGARIIGKENVEKFLSWAKNIKPALEENPAWYKLQS